MRKLPGAVDVGKLETRGKQGVLDGGASQKKDAETSRGDARTSRKNVELPPVPAVKWAPIAWRNGQYANCVRFNM